MELKERRGARTELENKALADWGMKRVVTTRTKDILFTSLSRERYRISMIGQAVFTILLDIISSFFVYIQPIVQPCHSNRNKTIRKVNN